MTKVTYVGIDLAIDRDTTVAVFSNSGEFQACWAAEAWCEQQGISVGAMQGPEQRGLLWGWFQIAKWRNLTAAERANLDGTMTGSMRHGPVTVTIKSRPETPF